MARWYGGIEPHHSRLELVADMAHGLAYALAQVALLVAVAQFHGLARAGGGSRGNGRAPDDA
jgi:hypothetical protein